MSATSQITLGGADNGDKGNGWSMSDSISFSASGEMDNGFTVTHSIELDGGAGVSDETVKFEVKYVPSYIVTLLKVAIPSTTGTVTSLGMQKE